MPANISLLLLATVAVILSSRRGISCGSEGSGGDGVGEGVQWQILTKLNYSSYITLHPNFLLLVTVPWFGESRSLMKDLSHSVASDQLRFGTLKLVVIYRNSERILADSLGASEGITIFYYHNSFSYRYRGKLNVLSIFSSVNHVMTLSPEELPLKSLNTLGEMKDFLDSTDKAVLLLEFCGWIPRLLSRDTNFHGETHETRAAEDIDDEKGLGDVDFRFGIDNESQRSSWMKQFTPVNDSFMMEAENFTFSSGVSCSLDEFQRFELFLRKFIRFSREFFLPHERHRFALVSDTSLLPLLNVDKSDSWFITIKFSGSPHSKILREGDDLRTVLKHPSPVMELEDDSHGVETTLPAKIPAALLFVDRSAESMHVRMESRRALNAFRELAQQYDISDKKYGEASTWPGMSMGAGQALLSTPKQHFLSDKMSIMIMKEQKQFTLEDLVSDLQGSSLHEFLTYALKRKQEMKLSSLAKDAKFQHLSKNFDIEVLESVPSNIGIQSDQLGAPFVEAQVKNTVDVHKNKMQSVSSSGQHEGESSPSDADYIPLEDQEESLAKSRHSSEKSEDAHRQDGVVEEIRLLEINDTLQKIFNGSFLFYDGPSRLLETLTGGSHIPRVIIIDPVSEKHYVLAEQSVLNCSLLSDFINNYLQGKLLPYQKSSPLVHSPVDAPRPPFVNLDYHEKDSIPLVTIHTFSELVMGKKGSEHSCSSWDRNVLVLFSNSWCGFCQRMELVVREVHRAIKGFEKLNMNSSKMENLKLTCEYDEDAAKSLPLIYLMDCTQNDCGLILKPIMQRELYPLLLLFPAGRKKNAVPYEGDIAVLDIIKFLSGYGTHANDLLMDRISYLKDHNSAKEITQGRTLPFEVLLRDRLQDVGVKHSQTDSQFLIGTHDWPQLYVGCMLSATEKLLDVHPFDESRIIIVKMEQGTGFLGLIINKRIAWDALGEEFNLLNGSPLYFGGPVVRRKMPLVALTYKSVETKSVEVLPEIYYVDHWATQGLIEEIRVGNQSAHDYIFFLGYSSWGWDQLFHEIAQGAWNTSRGSLEHLEWPWM